MDFKAVIENARTIVTQKYYCFDGRAGRQEFWYWVLACFVVSFVLGFFGLLQALGLLSGVPVLAFGIPALLSVYFDIFSGFVQALVFTLLSMVYIAGSLPENAAAAAD